MRYAILVLIFFPFFNFISCINTNTDNYNSKPVIFDTDMGPDYDDVGALAVLHALADSEEVNILATISSNKYKNSVPCIEVINTYFCRPNLPTAKPIKGINMVDKRFIDDYWAEKIPLQYPHKTKTTGKAPNAVGLYRQLLNTQADSSVVIITVGFLTNLAELLHSLPDKYCCLEGKALINKKVKRLVCMAGKFPAGREFNVFTDINSSKIVFNEWPTPILLCGFEIGRDIYTGLNLVASDLQKSPVKDVYAMCMKKDIKGRSSWDQITVLVGVRGSENYFYTEKGRMFVTSDGSNQWENDINGTHEHLKFKMPKEKLTLIIESLMMHEPVNRPFE